MTASCIDEPSVARMKPRAAPPISGLPEIGAHSVHIGTVQAPDPDAAIKAAIRKYDIAPGHQQLRRGRSCAEGSVRRRGPLATRIWDEKAAGFSRRRESPGDTIAAPWHPDVKLGPSLSYTILDMIRWYSRASYVKSAGERDRASCSRMSRPCPGKTGQCSKSASHTLACPVRRCQTAEPS